MVTSRIRRRYKLAHMRTYSHVLLTLAVARRSSNRAAVCASAGAVLPDLPALAGGLWLRTKRKAPFTRKRFGKEVCGRPRFRAPDAALHSILPVAFALTLYAMPGTGNREPRGALPAFLLGWLGHIAVDALTHAEDARPLLWPLSERRFRGPVSYWDHERHGQVFTVTEHAALLVVALWLLYSFRRERRAR